MKRILFLSLVLFEISTITSSHDLMAQSQGYLGFDQWAVVYRGEKERCYNVKYTRRVYRGQGPSQEDSRIVVYSNGEKVARLYEIQSTDVCGSKIEVWGWCDYGTSLMYWEATPIFNQR